MGALVAVAIAVAIVLLVQRSAAQESSTYSPDSTGSADAAQALPDDIESVAPPQYDGGSMADPNFIEQWAQAIQQHEGWYPGSHSFRNNNPGNLRVPTNRDYTYFVGATGMDSGRFAIFPDYPTGFNALVNLLNVYVRKYSNYNILQIMTHYLGGDVNNPQVTGEGDPFAYAQAVADATGLPVDQTTIGEAAGGGTGG